MLAAPVLAQSTELNLPEAGGGEIIVWVILAVVIVALYVIITRTRKRSYRSYMDREQREAEMRANDPDMRQED
jgi:heme exporter protein D